MATDTQESRTRGRTAGTLAALNNWPMPYRQAGSDEDSVAAEEYNHAAREAFEFWGARLITAGSDREALGAVIAATGEVPRTSVPAYVARWSAHLGG